MLLAIIISFFCLFITHSLFHSRLKTFFFCKSFPLQLFVSSSGLTLRIPRTVVDISEHIRFLLLSFSVLHFLVVVSVR